MRIVCPKCHAAYQVDAVIKNAILVCHKCHTEFDTFGNLVTPDTETSQIFKAQEENAPTFGLYDLVQTGFRNQHSHVWFFMIIVLMTISAAGVFLHWNHWQYNSLVRGYQLESNLSAAVTDRDWHILPESVHLQWLTRDDQSLALLVEGQVESLVMAPLPTPEIKVTFVTQTGKNIDLIQAVTEPAELATLRAVPFASPPVDKTPVSAMGKRGFLLLIEDAPSSTQHILLHALAVQRKGAAKL